MSAYAGLRIVVTACRLLKEDQQSVGVFDPVKDVSFLGKSLQHLFDRDVPERGCKFRLGWKCVSNLDGQSCFLAELS